jgi:tRNA U34 5-carboxymethylaminomethyl modifying GTPase MnmE/TrmE
MSTVPWNLLIRSSFTAYQKRHLLQHLWKNLLTFSDLGKTNIVVLGRPAVGKSVLTSKLYGEANDFSWELPDTSSQVESRAIQLGEWTSLVRVIPGQTTTESDIGIDEAFNKHNELEGVMFVADWGFTGVRDNTLKESMIKNYKIDTLEKLRQHNLKSELAYFKRTCDKIREAYSCGRKIKWLLIVLNKVDLFSESVEDAMNYYYSNPESPFVEVLNETLKSIGELNIKCAIMPISAWQSDFQWNDEKVKTNLGGTDIERELFRELITKIAEFSK